MILAESLRNRVGGDGPPHGSPKENRFGQDNHRRSDGEAVGELVSKFEKFSEDAHAAQ